MTARPLIHILGLGEEQFSIRISVLEFFSSLYLSLRNRLDASSLIGTNRKTFLLSQERIRLTERQQKEHLSSNKIKA